MCPCNFHMTCNPYEGFLLSNKKWKVMNCVLFTQSRHGCDGDFRLEDDDPSPSPSHSRSVPSAGQSAKSTVGTATKKDQASLMIDMGGRLPAVAGMPANRTFLELSAGQSDWPEKICVVLLPKKRRRPVSFRHEEKRFSLWTAPCLSIKSGVYRVTFAIFRLPSLIIL